MRSAVFLVVSALPPERDSIRYSTRSSARKQAGRVNLYSSRKQQMPPQFRSGTKDVTTPTNRNKAGTPINRSLTQIFRWEKFQNRAGAHRTQISIPLVQWSTRYEVKTLFEAVASLPLSCARDCASESGLCHPQEVGARGRVVRRGLGGGDQRVRD